MKTIRSCFQMILNGNKEECRIAARQVRKILYRGSDDRSKYDHIDEAVSTAPDAWLTITEPWRQQDYVIAISVIYFLHKNQSQPDFLFPWLLQLIQHSNGYIRHAAVKMLTNEFGPLTYHLRFPNSDNDRDDIKPELADRIIGDLFDKLNQLLGAYDEPRYDKYKHVESLPPSVYKSLQMVVTELIDMSDANY